MGRRLLAAVGILVLLALAAAGALYWRNLRGLAPALLPAPQDIAALIGTTRAPAVNNTGFPLQLPPGFSISVFAKDLGKPRVMSLAPDGSLLVSVPEDGKVLALYDRDGDGYAEDRVIVLENLQQPHGLAWRCHELCTLYVAETHRVATYSYDISTRRGSFIKTILDLPDSGGHWTRTIMFLPSPREDELLVSIGSSCNVCREQDSRRASVMVVNYDGSNPRTFAHGLRNAVFMAIHPVDGRVWVTEMGRDLLGDELPPDEINIVEEDRNYGWPLCYGQNVHDTRFDDSVYKRNPCEVPLAYQSQLDLPAHSAPLGLAFIPEDPPRLAGASGGEAGGWPEDWWYDLLVAYHGSWNRSEPTGYKVVRFPLDAQGKPTGEPVDFIAGWLQGARALGRPVDILVQPGGTMYISDDKAGVIYRLYNSSVNATP